MLRVAIPIILAVASLASATVFRALLLPLIVSVLVGLIMAAMRSSARRGRGPGQARKEPDNVVDGSYTMVDDEPKN